MPSRQTSLLAALLFAAGLSPCAAADIKVLSAGAMKAVVIALAPEFEKQSGHTLTIDSATAGGLQKRIADGEKFDVAIITPQVMATLAESGKIASQSISNIAKVGIGVAVKSGAAKPDISTVAAFKSALLASKGVAYIDPKAGGSSGIYFDKLLDTLGIATDVRGKAKLKQGGYVAEAVANGEADIAVHQISEILPVGGVTLVGPLPAEIQNYTTYTAGMGAAAADTSAATALLVYLRSDATKAVLKAKGLDLP